MSKDWVQWHRDYDEPTSSLARRLRVVQRDLRRALADVLPDGTGQLRLISICAGDGRDVLPVLAAHHSARGIRALLVELDPRLADRARTTASELGLPTVEIRIADAGITNPYLDITPAHVVLACGVFGNITVGDARQTITTLPSLLTPGGVVIWTRGRNDDGTDPSQLIRELFTEHGFTELSFTAPSEARFRVGAHRLENPPTNEAPLRPGIRMFAFT